LAAAVFLGHSFMIGDAVFMVTQLVNMVAMAIILVLARRFRNQICAAHARQSCALQFAETSPCA
jgi:hypothetical protein